MMFFPQLSTGALTQFPVIRRRLLRTVLNQTANGDEVKYFDADAGILEWELQLRGLTDAERAAIETLFENCRGPLKEFTFLDPAGNLLAYSEALQEPAWAADPALTLAAGIADPFGTAGATEITNTGQGAQRLTQTVAASAGFHYCLSVYVRSTGGSSVRLVLGSGSGEQSSLHNAGSDWRRVWLSAKPGGSDESIFAGLELDAGARAEVFGPQLEAQPNPSGYKRTAGSGGVHRARFSGDVLAATAEGPDNHLMTLRITSRIEA